MKITIAEIEKLNPCEDRLDNFKYHYPKFKGSVETFLALKEITHSDKIWVVCRLMTDKQLFAFAKAVAYSVLEIYENYVPNDISVRNLLELLNKYEYLEQAKLDVNFSRTAAAAFAYAYAYAAVHASAAYYAAKAASYAFSTAYLSASYVAYFASAATNAAYSASNAYFRSEQEEFQLIVISYIIKNVK